MTVLRWSIPLFSAFPSASQCQWQSLDDGVSHEVRAFEFSPDSTTLIMGGKFVWTLGDSLRANDLASWDGTEWSVAGFGGGNGDTSLYGTIGQPITSMSLFHDSLFISYLSNYWQHEPIRSAAILTNDEWFHCGDPENWFFVNDVNGRLFSYGRADTLYGEYMPNVREWTNGAWATLPGSPFGATGSVFAAERWQGDYYFAGNFLEGDMRGIVRYDGLDQWSPLAGGVGGTFIRAMAGYGDSLYVGGFLPLGPNVQSTHIQIWDGTSWLPFFPQVEYYGTVMDIQVYDGVLYIAGIFHFAGEATWYDLLRYDGHELCAIGGPTPSGDNGEIEFFQGDLYMALGPTFEALPNENIGRLPLAGLVPDTCIAVVGTGINDVVGISAMSLSPNPVVDQLHVANALVGCSRIQVVDAVGRPVLDRPCGSGANLIDVGSLAPACYTLQMLDPLGLSLAQQKFIKQ